MRKPLALLSILAMLLSLAATPAIAAGPVGGNAAASRTDNFDHPLGTKQAELKQTGLELLAKGEAKATGDNQVVKVAPGQYVELALEDTDSIFTVLGQFSDLDHNQIAEPDRSADNTTIWEPDFSQDYYRNLLFSQANGANTMANFYLEQSSGAYTVDGDVTDWVSVPEPGAFYGSNAKSDAYAWLFIEDQLAAWVQAQHDAGMTDADIADYLAQFDVWDRYDYDGDGNFDEPDGYVDHFQSIHSGEGEEAGGGTLGDDAIWSHRWYAFYYNEGVDGPSYNLLGGIQIPGTDLWIGDYTIEPENGGVGVFAHEFAHDLGLPDEYDTSGNSGGAENSTGFWTLMSSGSWGNNGVAAEGIGDRPFHMNAWDKWFLGWLDYSVVGPGDGKKSLKLGPAEHATKKSQGLIVVLPDREHEVFIGDPFEGSNFYYSGAANSLTTEMTKSFDLPVGASLTAKVRYSIEEDFDYAYVTVDDTKVGTTLSNSSVVTEGIDGASGGWVDLDVDLSAYTGTHTIGFGYFTDGGVQGAGGPDAPGVAIDNIAITGQAVDGAESDAGWTFTTDSDTGFGVTSGTEIFNVFNAYVAENRQYVGYDAGLATGPYNFTTDTWAERFPYQDGLLIWYYDSFYSDNAVGDHPGEGLILPVDARPEILHWADDGTNMRGRFQPFDATFGTPAQSITLHHNDVATTIPAQAAVNVFDDMNSYYRASDPADGISHYQAGWFSVNNPHTGTVIRVKSVTPSGMMQIEVTAPH